MRNQRHGFNKDLDKDLREIVYKRDGRRCQWPDCKCHQHLQIHHILPWAQYPHLRYEASNCIVLCKTHHEQIKSSEAAFAPMFINIVYLNSKKSEKKVKKNGKSNNVRHNKRHKRKG